MTDEPAYGLWSLVVINSLVFIIFAFSFSKPRTPRDWRSFSAFSGFVVALFVEMYGFPLTIYLLSGWLVNRYPGVDLFSHDAGHLWNTLLGWKVNPHFDPLHILSNVLILCGFILLSAAWKVLYEAQRTKTLATTGPYAYVRHPQYDGFILIMCSGPVEQLSPSTSISSASIVVIALAMSVPSSIRPLVSSVTCAWTGTRNPRSANNRSNPASAAFTSRMSCDVSTSSTSTPPSMRYLACW